MAYTTKDYLEKDFFTLVGLESLSDTDKQEYLEKMNQTVMGHVYEAIMSEMTDEEKDQFDAIPSDQVVAWLGEKGFDFPALILEESIRYRFQVIKNMEMMTSMIAAPSAS